MDFRKLSLWLGYLASALLPLFWIEDPAMARTTAIVASCLYLWLLELVPNFVPTLMLLVLCPLFLKGEVFQMSTLMRWGCDPVLLLFFGGFSLGAVLHDQQLDKKIVGSILRLSQHKKRALIALSILISAFLSMWMSNVAAATLLLVAFRGIYNHAHMGKGIKTPLLLSIALGASFGGMATPLGAGPNGIAISALQASHPTTFAKWMLLAMPMTIGFLLVSYFFLIFRYKISGEFRLPEGSLPEGEMNLSRKSKTTIVISSAAIVLFLSEGIHGVPASLISACIPIALVFAGIFEAKHLKEIDWSMLLLLSGGLILGRVVEESGMLDLILGKIQSAELSPLQLSSALICLAALMSAVMSNTATATILIPAALKILPGTPEISIVLAIATSLGIPFVISTPMNAAIRGEGVEAKEIFLPGILLMIFGCLLLSLTGVSFLQLLHD